MSSAFTEEIKRLTRQDEARDRQEMSRESEPSPSAVPLPSGAAASLMANAGEIDFTVSPTPAYLSDLQLEVQGTQFVDGLNYLLDYLDWRNRSECAERGVEPKELSPETRHLVLALVGLTGGDYLTAKAVTQKQIAQRLGVKSLKTLRERLRALYDWEQQSNRAVVRIIERERGEGSVQFETTLYQPVIVRAAAELIRRTKARGLRPVNEQRGLNPRTELIADAVTADADEEAERLEIAGEVADEMDEAERSRKRETKTRTAQAQPRMRFLEEKEVKAINAVKAWAQAHMDAGYPPLDHAGDLFLKLQAAMESVISEKRQNW